MANEAKQFTIGGVTHDVMDEVARQLISSLTSRIDTLIGSGNVQGAIDTFNEITAFLNGIDTSDPTLRNQLLALNNAITTLQSTLANKANAADVYDKQTVDDMVDDAGKVKTVTINGQKKTPNEETGDVDLGEVQGSSGITPHIDVVTGHWFIGDEDTGIDARGLQGNSGYTGAAGELEVVEDYTEGGVGKAASAEAVKNMAIKSIPGAGSFADAYEKARANNVVFPWFLRDVDENGNPIEKMIWHNGYRKFVDAIGAEVDGLKNGFTVKVNAACDLRVSKRNTSAAPTYIKTHNLVSGENNITFEDFPWDGNDIMVIAFCKSGETTETSESKSYVEEIDFGGMYLNVNSSSLSSYNSLRKIKRLVAKTTGAALFLQSNPLLSELQMSGETAAADYYCFLLNCPKVERADLKGFSTEFVAGNGLVNACTVDPGQRPFALRYLDIRNVGTAHANKIQNFLRYANSLETLIIGNFTNADTTASNGDALSGVTDCVLICTTSTPPILKNCTFADGVAQDVHDPAVDWLAYVEGGVTKCHFSAIYVPSDAVTAYKSNVYVTGGVEGNTGWSRWADLIHDIAGTEYEDLI